MILLISTIVILFSSKLGVISLFVTSLRILLKSKYLDIWTFFT